MHFTPRSAILHHCGTNIISNLEIDIGPLQLTDLTHFLSIFAGTHLCVHVCLWFYAILSHVFLWASQVAQW